MKRFIVLFLILIVSIMGFASYPSSGTYQDLSGGGFYQWIVVRSVFPDSTLASQLGDTSQYFYRAYIDTLWVNSIRGVDLDSVGTNNPDSLGNRPASAYLINTNDTSAILYITKAYIDSFLDDSISSKSAFKMLNKSIKFTNAAGDTVKALIQGDFMGLYDYVNNVTSVIGNQGFYKYNTAGDSGYFYLKDSSLTYWNYTTQIPVLKLSVNSSGEGEALFQSDRYKLGIYAYGHGIVNPAGDSSYLGMDTIGLSILDYTTQNTMASYSKNGIRLNRADGSAYAKILKDSIFLTDSLFGDSLIYNAYWHNWRFNDTLLIGEEMIAPNCSITNRLTVNDSLIVNKIIADTIDDGESSLYFDTDTIKIKPKTILRMGDITNNVDSVEISIGKDTLTLMDYQISVRDSFNRITLSKSNLYYIRDGLLDWAQHQYAYWWFSYKPIGGAYWFNIDTLNYMWKADAFNFKSFTDSTKMVSFVKDSMATRTASFTGAIKSLSGSDSTLITDGTITVTDSVIGNGASYAVGFNKMTTDSAIIGDNLIYDNGTYIQTTYLQATSFYATDRFLSLKHSSVASYPLKLAYNASTNPLIRWLFLNDDIDTDTSLVEDSSAAVNGTKGRIRFYRETTFKQPTFFDSLATFGKVTVNNMFKLAEGRFKDDTVFLLTDTLTTFTNGMQFIDTTGDDSLYTRVRDIWIKQ